MITIHNLKLWEQQPKHSTRHRIIGTVVEKFWADLGEHINY
jgi:hypothetical protein